MLASVTKKIILITFSVIFRIFKVRILTNHMFGSTGHTFLELQYIFLISKKLDYKKYNYYLFTNRTKFTSELKKIYPSFFYTNKQKPIFKLIIINKYFEYILNIILSFNNNFTYDVGLGHFTNVGHFTNDYKKMRSGSDGFSRYIDYYRIKSANKKKFYNEAIFKNQSHILRKKLGIKAKDKIVNIHLKNLSGNSCAKKTEPQTYIQTIKYIKKRGYKIIFIGREKMPNIFKKYQIFDYANSQFSNIKNDLLITYTSSFNICFASGIYSLANYLNKPLLYLGSWHLNIQSHYSKCVYFPAVLKLEKNNKYVNYNEQIRKVVSDEVVFKGFNFKKDKIKVINPTSNDILFSFKELENLVLKNYKKTSLQKKFNKKFKAHPQEYSQSIVSKKFLKKYYSKIFT